MAPDSIRIHRIAAALAIMLAALAGAVGVAPSAHADEWRDKQWHMDSLKADEVHEITKGDGVTVAVVDTGVDGDHPDLKGNVLKGRDFTSEGDPWKDVDGHGTAMASNIAGHGHGRDGEDGILGLAPEAKILPVRDHIGGSTEEEESDTARAIEWARLSGAQVINFSAVRGGLRDAVKETLSKDVVIVAGVGNTAQGHSDVQPPANYPGVVAVSGIDKNGNFTDESAQGPEVVLAAPAVDIASAASGARGSYTVATGTSDAAAFVSATAALIRSKYPDISANGVINRLILTADDKGPLGRDPQYGFGIVNPLRALTADIPDIDHNPLIKGSPMPSRSSATSAAAGDPDEGGGRYLLPMLGILGGAGAVTLAGVGALLIARNRRRSTSPQSASGGPAPPHSNSQFPPGPPAH